MDVYLFIIESFLTMKMLAVGLFSDICSRVPVHEFYYGQMAGALTYREEKGQYKFKVSKTSDHIHLKNIIVFC